MYWFKIYCHFYKTLNEKSINRSINPSARSGWNKLDFNHRNSESLNNFKKKLLNYMRALANKIIDTHNPLGIKLFTRLRLGLKVTFMNIDLGIAFKIL